MNDIPKAGVTNLGPVDVTQSPFARRRTLPLSAVQICGGFWGRRMDTNRHRSLPHGFEMLEKAGNFEALRLAAGVGNGEPRGMVFRDSDVYKWLEAASYVLGESDNGALSGQVDAALQLVARAQQPDGYLNTYTQLQRGGRRWENLEDLHELYCVGHLIQAGIAHFRAWGRRSLLDVAQRSADQVERTFGPGRSPGICGHPEIEMALIELFRVTRQLRYLKLAEHFLAARGHGRLGSRPTGSDYWQDRVPIRQAREVVGHAVRQLYFAAGAADLCLELEEPELLSALRAQWEDMNQRKLYVTGGVGARPQTEAFGAAYELPGDSAHCETCAAIASVFWCFRMQLLGGGARYAELVEQQLYNAVLPGVSDDGTRFFYQNPMATTGGYERSVWHDCACCPPNVMRLLASLGQYFATASDDGVQIHQYGSARVQARGLVLELESDYPWQGKVTLHVLAAPDHPVTLDLRVPSFCRDPRLRGAAAVLRRGYLQCRRTFRRGERLQLDLPFAAQWLDAHPRVEAARGAVALRRGPLVYCFEAVDAPADLDLRHACVDPAVPVREGVDPDLAGGVVTLEVTGAELDVSPFGGALYRDRSEPLAERRRVTLRAVPYFAWAHRGATAMRVWMRAR
jgi:DUF1680 family protein